MLILVVVLACIPAIIFVERAQRRIPVNYAKRVQGRKMMGGQSTYIPLKVNAAGVIPIIFASCLIYFPAQLAALFNVDWLNAFANAISTGWVNWILTVAAHRVLRVLLHVHGVQPRGDGGQPAQAGRLHPRRATRVPLRCTYIKNVLQSRDAARRHLHRAASRSCPRCMFYFTGNQLIQAFGGTSILIMIGVALDTMTQGGKSQLKMHNYEGFFK